MKRHHNSFFFTDSYEPNELQRQQARRDHPAAAAAEDGLGFQFKGHANTVPQTGHRGGHRKLPQTPKTPSTLPAQLQHQNGGPALHNKKTNKKLLPHFVAIDPRNSSDLK